MNTLQHKYKQDLVSKIQQQLGIKNIMAVPRLTKIVVNIGIKEALTDKKSMDRAIEILSQITGQKPRVTKAKKAIASFKLRQGDEIGVAVTLRGARMYDFFQKLTSIVLPRLRDFHGVKKTSFDKHGNYTLGISEHSVFPEIDMGKVDKIQGLEIVIATSAKDDTEGFELLKTLGMPFAK